MDRRDSRDQEQAVGQEVLPADLDALRQRCAELEQAAVAAKRTEAALAESEEKYRLLFATVTDAIIVFDAETRRFMDANESALRLYGYTRDEFLRLTHGEITAEPAASETSIQETLAGVRRGVPLRYHVKKDGTVFPVEISPGAFVLGGRRVLCGVIRDITERKKADHALRVRSRQLEALRAVSAEIARELDLPTLLSLILRRAGELLGVFSGAIFLWDEAAEVLVPRALFGEIHPAERVPRRLGEGLVGAVAQRREGMLVNEYRTSPYRLPPVLAHTSTTAALAEPLLYRERLLGVLTLNNRGTERRFTDGDLELLRLFAPQVAVAIENARLYEQVRRHAEELEGKVADRTKELQAANTQLEAANADLEAFSYSVSHDLRTPLISIDGFSRLLLKKYGTALEAQGKDYLQRVRAGAQRMGDLIDALLALARVGRHALRRELVDLSALARAITRDLGQRDPRRAAQVAIQDGLLVQGDARLLRALLENLLGNAWKFTAHRRPARIEVGRLPGGEGAAVYFVRDNGVGFDMADADRLFGVFRRLHSAQEFPGTGIGLATVQRIVQRHGGRVWAEGVVEGGATFFFTVGAPDPGPELGPRAVA